ncbi:hypothetical protein [Ktedonospora formicarum]|uniref:C-type cytochrome biogenesis protein CcmI n=1 Tax=Ktedonospora formicarum TaxID=2778364 RepID=A0A8J3HZ73_9CHLR|nr:hypothetical protein [Ktedonospora formicarum]GHO43703.1 hypothetical protein KSX_18660 [Ktedonospora formicarum]
MAISIAIILALLALAFVAYPLLKGVPALQTESAPDSVQKPELKPDASTTEQEVAAKTALQEVELDYQLGNIDEPDYQTMRERYMRRALVALKARHDEEQAIDERIEEQLRTMREQEKESE